jgi:hypothetical protein
MQITPQATRMIIKTLKLQEAIWRHEIDNGYLSEDGAADMINDVAYVITIRKSLEVTVAESADAPDLKSGIVQVQVLPVAP